MPEPKKDEGKKLSIPDDADEESKKIAEEIAKEGEAKAKEEKPEEAPKEPEKAKEEEKPEKKEEAGKEGEKKEEEIEEEDEEEKPQRTPKLMPLFKHKIAESQWQKEKEEMQKKIETLESKTKGESSEDKEKMIEEFAEKNGIDKEVIKGLVKLVGVGNTAALEEKISKLEARLTETSKITEEEKQDKLFNKEFEKEIAPLIEQDGISPENQKRVKKLLYSLAFTEEFGNTPLKFIYKGHESFDDFRKKGRKSGESSGPAAHAGDGKEKSFMEMDDDEFEKESEELGKKDKNRDIRRDGKSIGSV